MDTTAASMDALEISAFLETQSAGVLAMGTTEGVYAVPVSYATLDGGQDLFFRLGYGPESQKRRFIEEADTATFVVFGETESGWKSVIAEGRIDPVAESNLETAVIQAVERLHIPFFQVHRHPADELEFSIVRIDVDRLSGVAEPRRVRTVD